MTDEEVAGPVIRLEQQEVDCQTGSGAVPGSVYCELLAAYLASNQRTLANLLIGRVPSDVMEDPEFDRLWTIGKNMWSGNTAEVNSSLAGPWSESVQRIMDKLNTTQQNENLSDYQKIKEKISGLNNILTNGQKMCEQQIKENLRRTGVSFIREKSGDCGPDRMTVEKEKKFLLFLASISSACQEKIEEYLNLSSFSKEEQYEEPETMAQLEEGASPV